MALKHFFNGDPSTPFEYSKFNRSLCPPRNKAVYMLHWTQRFPAARQASSTPFSLKTMCFPTFIGNISLVWNTTISGLFGGGGGKCQCTYLWHLQPLQYLTIYIKYNSALLKADSHRSKLTGLTSFLQWWSSHSLYRIPMRQHSPYSILLSEAFERIWGEDRTWHNPSCYFPPIHRVTCRQRHCRLRCSYRTPTTCPCWIQDWVCRSWPCRKRCICAQMKGETLESWKGLQAEGSNNS